MMQFNYTAGVFWAALACVGYLLGDIKGAVAGLAAGLTLTFLADMSGRKK